MPWQLIYTSAPRGLLSGQSGFCTVSRSADLREALAQRLEQISAYHYLRVAEAATAKRNPAICAFRLLDLRGAKYYVLTRIQPCGLDFTARTNHLAHHLVFQADELVKLPSPAAILRHWPGWLSCWQGEPRLREEIGLEEFAAAGRTFLPAQTWARLTGDGGRAAGLLESECVRGCYLVCSPGSEEQVLELYCETLALLNFNGQFPLRPWRHTFTTFLQGEDNPNDFQWRACQENTPAHQQALKRSGPMLALQSVRVPANSLVKLAREAPKPPPGRPPSNPAAGPALSLRRETTNRGGAAPAPSFEKVNLKTAARTPKPALLDINFSIHSATLASVGIFAAVLVVLWLIKHHPAPRTAEQGSSPPAAIAQPPPAATLPSKSLAPEARVPAAKQLERLVGDGPTYVLAAPNLRHFSLPIDSISRLQNLLNRYDKFETLPSKIRLEVETDHWDFPPGAPMTVGGRKDAPRFTAAAPGMECLFDYADWLADKRAPVTVQVNFERGPKAFSIHFGFASTNDGDPFRLLIVNENNPPAPLPFARSFVQMDRQDVGASLRRAMRECLMTNFQLLAGWQWQLQPFVKPRSRPAQYLYRDWPAADRPVFGCELDFAHIGQRLRAQRQDLRKSLDLKSQALGVPLGEALGTTNASLESFLIFSSEELRPGRFLTYLDELKKSAPEKSWIKKWHNRVYADQPEEVYGKFEELYDLWCEKEPQDRSMLTVSNGGGTTNYFARAWQILKETASAQEQLGKVQKRLVELEQVAYIELSIVDPRQLGAGLEMIRFEEP